MTRRVKNTYLKDYGKRDVRMQMIERNGIYHCPICFTRVNKYLSFYCPKCRQHLEVDYGGLPY